MADGVLRQAIRRVTPVGVRRLAKDRILRPLRLSQSLTLNKPCEIEDFGSPELVRIIRCVYPHNVQRKGPSYPHGMEYRKDWEVAMAVLAMERHGALSNNAFVLGVGAGQEITTFYLTNFVRWVFATDLYANPSEEWHDAAPLAMLTSPETLSPIPCRPNRLVVQHMDGRSLRYEDGTFDAIYSSSSIEHFGDWEDVASAAREMGRVLKPGGLLTLSTEYRLTGEGKGLPGVLMFNQEELFSLIVGPSGLTPVGRPRFSVSERTLATAMSHAEAMEQGRQGQVPLPQIVYEYQGYTFCPYHLALTKKA